MARAERFNGLTDAKITQELVALRNGGLDSESAWLRFQSILTGNLEGWPDKFFPVAGPIKRIFEIRMSVFLRQTGPTIARDSVVAVLSELDGHQRSLLEEVLPMVDYAFKPSRRLTVSSTPP